MYICRTSDQCSQILHKNFFFHIQIVKDHLKTFKINDNSLNNVLNNITKFLNPEAIGGKNNLCFCEPYNL